MSVSQAQPSDDPEPAPACYLEITQDPDGRIDAVAAKDRRPLPESIFTRSPRTTVWATDIPQHGAAHSANKVLDLALSNTFRDADPHQWATGERKESAYYSGSTTDRAMLRAVEAHIILAGHLDVNTGVVQHQGYGLTITTGDHLGGQHEVFRLTDGTWKIAMQDCRSYDGWYVFGGPLAPANASPHAVATAILAHVYDRTDTPGELRPLARARVAYAPWRCTPRWAVFKYRARLRLGRYRRRITIRYVQWRCTPRWAVFKYRARLRLGRWRRRITIRIPRG